MFVTVLSDRFLESLSVLLYVSYSSHLSFMSCKNKRKNWTLTFQLHSHLHHSLWKKYCISSFIETKPCLVLSFVAWDSQEGMKKEVDLLFISRLLPDGLKIQLSKPRVSSLVGTQWEKKNNRLQIDVAVWWTGDLSLPLTKDSCLCQSPITLIRTEQVSLITGIFAFWSLSLGVASIWSYAPFIPTAAMSSFTTSMYLLFSHPLDPFLVALTSALHTGITRTGIQISLLFLLSVCPNHLNLLPCIYMYLQNI